MSKCYKCGEPYSGYGPICGLCSQTEVLKEQSEKNLSAQQDFAKQQHRDSQEKNNILREQLEVSKRTSEERAQVEHAKLNELEYQTKIIEEEAKKQTKLLLEQSILDSDAYREGFNLENISENQNGIDSQISFQHHVNIMFDYDGNLYIENAVPDFLTPRLNNAYLAGLRDRLKQDFSEPIESNVLGKLAYSAGRNGTSLEAQKLFNRYIFMTYELELSKDRRINIHTSKVALSLKYETDLTSGKAVAYIGNPHIFNNHKLDDEFNKGLQDYLQSINDESSCNRRLYLYQKRTNLRNDAIKRNAEREERYLNASDELEKSKSNKFKLEIFIKLIAVNPVYFLWESDHGIIAAIYLLLYIFMIFIPFTGTLNSDSLVKDMPERLPFVCDPIYESFGDFYNGEEDFLYGRAVAIILESKRASASFLQRQLGIGFNRASKLLEAMESAGIVSKPNHEGGRVILI